MNEGLVVRAVIAAGGAGSRFGGPAPKQFSLLGGLPVMLHGARVLAAHAAIKEIVFALPEGEFPPEILPYFLKLQSEFSQVAFKRVQGGKRRQDSVAAGLRSFTGSCDIALVHDAARPFPPGVALDSLINKAHELGGALLATTSTDTVKQSNEKGIVTATLDRKKIWLAQTPQAIRGDLIARVTDLLESESDFTDEAAALEALGVAVALVPGSESNFKITRPEDLARAESHLKTTV